MRLEVLLVACLAFAVALECEDNKAYIKYIKVNKAWASEESFIIRDGTTTIYTGNQFVNNEDKTLEVCLTASATYMYSIDLKDSYGDGWGGSLTIEGLYGNIIFRSYVPSSENGNSVYPTYKFVAGYAIPKQGDWKYSASAEASWNTFSFSDSAWTTYNAASSTTAVSGTQYYRKTFGSMTDIVAYETRINYKAGIVAYINGVEVFRDNMADGAVTASTASTGSYSAYEFRGFIRPAADLEANTNNVLAVEVHFNPADTSETPVFDAWLALLPANSPGSNCNFVPYTPTLTSSESCGTLANLYDYNTQTSAETADVWTSPFDLIFSYPNLSIFANGFENYPAYATGHQPYNFMLSGTNESGTNPTYTDLFGSTSQSYDSNTKNVVYTYFVTNYSKTLRLRVNANSNSNGKLAFYEFHLGVCNYPLPTAMTFTPSSVTVVQNVDSVNIVPEIDGFTGCSVNPALPQGLTLDPITCHITGMVAQALTTTVYTITSTSGSGYTATVTITATACNGNVIEVKRVTTGSSSYEKYEIIDLATLTTVILSDYNTAPTYSTVVSRHCLTGSRYELYLQHSSNSYWQSNSYVYIYGVTGESLEPIVRGRFDSQLGLPASINFNVNYAVKAYEQWSYKTSFVANWYNSDVSGWSTGARGTFTAGTGRVQIFKKTFTIASLQNISGFSINLRYKYGCIVYLNNHEVYRNRVTGDLSATSTATDSYSDLMYRVITLPVKTIALSGASAVDHITTGANVIAVALVAMEDTQTAIDFDCAVRLFGDELSDRLMEFEASGEGFSVANSVFTNYYASGTESYSCTGNSITLSFNDDRREWISSFSITNSFSYLTKNPVSVTLKARNSVSDQWTTLATYTGMKWSMLGQTKTIYIQNNNAYNTYKFDSITGEANGSSCSVYINRIGVYANNLHATVPTLSYESPVSGFKDIELAEIYPSSFLYNQFTVSPALPTGLAIDPVSGTISGTPTVEKAAQNYQISAKNIAGQSVTATLNLAIIICTGDVNLITLTLRSDTYNGEAAYTIYQGRGTTGTAYKTGTLLSPSAYHWVDMCVPSAIYTIKATDTYGDGWMSPAGYSVSIDELAMPFEMNQVKGNGQGQPTFSTLTFSSYIPFQAEYSDWKVFTGAAVASGWNTVAFSDAAWETKKAALVTSSDAATAYFRKTFDIPSLTDYHVLNVRVKYAGGLAAYFNGVLVARFNLPESFTESTEAPAGHDVEEFSMFHVILNAVGATATGNVIAFEHHRVTGASSINSVAFEASGVFGVEDCSTVLDSYSAITQTGDVSAASIFDNTPFEEYSLTNTQGTFVNWTVENLLGSKFNSFVMYTANSFGDYGFSLYGNNPEQEVFPLIEKTGASITSLQPNDFESPVGIMGFQNFRYEIDVPGTNPPLLNAFVFKYCKPSGDGMCEAMGEYPAVGSGQISPAACEPGFNGYSFRTCTNSIFSEIDRTHCTYKVPENLAYPQQRYSLIKDIAFATEAPTYNNIITEFFIDENVFLPEGLTLNPTTGVISGKPTQVFNAKEFTIYGKNAAATTSTTITLSVRLGECAADEDYPKTLVGSFATYECSKKGAYVGTLTRGCVLGEKDGVWNEPAGFCFPVILIVIIIIVVIAIIALLVFFIIRMSQKSKTVGSRGKKQGKTMKATPKKDAKKTKDVKV